MWLEIWWDIVRHPNTLVLQLWWGSWVLTGRNVAWIARNRNPWFCPVVVPTKENFNFFYHHCKGKVLTNIFYVETLFQTCLVWALRLFEQTQLVFQACAKTGFSPETTAQVHATYFKRCGAVFRIRLCLHGLSSSIRSEGMANHNFWGHCSGLRGT